MNQTKIEWTSLTWNPVHGCSRVSEGCRNCYAEQLSLRYGTTKKPWTVQNEQENVLLQRHKLKEPYRLKKPSMIFVNSMSDLFHEMIPDDYRQEIFGVMRDLPQHAFQVLTKRPQVAAEWPDWPSNVWLGVSVERQKEAERRVPLLAGIPAAIRFISAEPLLGELNLVQWLSSLQWVIAGGESGPNARPMNPGWARSLRDQCVAAGVPFFFKQWGEHDERLVRVGKQRAGHVLDGREWQQMPTPDEAPVQMALEL